MSSKLPLVQIHKYEPNSRELRLATKDAYIFTEKGAQPKPEKTTKSIVIASTSGIENTTIPHEESSDDSSLESDDSSNIVPPSPKPKRVSGSAICRRERLSNSDEEDLQDYTDPSDDDVDYKPEKKKPKGKTSVTLKVPDTNNPADLGPFDESVTSYYAYLQLPHGGRRPLSYAKAEMSKIMTLAGHAHNDPQSAPNLTEVWSDPMRLWIRFFEESLLQKTRQPTTLKGYSQTLQDYLHFITTRVQPANYSLNGEDITILTRLEKYQPKWRHSMSKEATEQRSSQLVRDQQNLIDISEMKFVIESDVFAGCKEKLIYLNTAYGSTGCWPQVAKKDFVLLRNFLAFKLVICHAGRAGMVANVTLQEFNNRLKTNDGSYVVNVLNHKTSYTGPQPFFLSESDVVLFKAYIGAIRTAFEGKHQPYLFLTESGTKIHSSGVSKMLLSFCKVSGANIQKPVHSTAIRKMWVSHMEMAGKTEGEKQDLALLMKHSRRTAEQWYDLTRKNQNAHKAAKLIQSELSTATATSSTEADKITTTSADSTPNLTVTCTSSISASTNTCSTKPNSADSTPISTATCSTSTDTHSTKPSEDVKPDKFFVAAVSNERYIWPSADEKEVRAAFKNILSSNKFPSKPEIVSTFQKSDKMLAIWNYSQSERWHDRCYEKVRNLYKSMHKKKNKF